MFAFFCTFVDTKVAKILCSKGSSAACEPRFLFSLCLRKLTRGALLFLCTFVPKQKYQKFSTQKEGMARHPYQQKPKFLRVYADFPSFAVAAYLLSFGVVLLGFFENHRDTILTYIRQMPPRLNRNCLVPLSNAATKVKRKHLKWKFRLFDRA